MLQLKTALRGLGQNKKTYRNKSLSINNMVKHLEKSLPLIAEEMARWKGLIWEDYLDYQTEQKRRKKSLVPWG